MVNAGVPYEGQYLGRQFGNYHLVKLLGEGGFSEVYLGEHVQLGTQVAVKVLTARLTGDEIERFRTEARMGMKLHHPHIVQTLDFGIENSHPFIVMRYATNGSLRQRHPEGTRVPLSTVVTYVKQIASALQYIHNQKLIYRDIKPENMLIGENGDIWLSDFGTAAIAHNTNSLVQLDKVGTVFYMAPEQIQGKPRPASDQYALAVTVYEWLGGALPFDGTVLEVVAQHLSSSAPPLHTKVPTISHAVEQVIQKALDKDHHHRFESVLKFAEALEQSSLEHITSMQQSFSQLICLLKWQHHTTAHAVPPLYTYHGHAAKVLAVAWSPDGAHIASAGVDHTVQVWDVSSGERVHIYEGHSAPVAAVTWAPDSAYVASGSSDRTLRVWSATSERCVRIYECHSDAVLATAWSPDGLHIASSSKDKTVRVWSTNSSELICTYYKHTLLVPAIAWSPHGTRIASGSWDQTVQVWYATSGVHNCTYRGHCAPVYAVAWSPELLFSMNRRDSYIASGGSDMSVKIWNADTMSRVFSYDGHTSSVTALAWSPDGTRMASGSADGAIQIWDIETGDHKHVYQGHSSQVTALTWSPDSTRVASSSWDMTVQVWQAG